MDNIQQTDISEEHIYPSIMNRIQALFFDVWILIGLMMYLSNTFFSDYQDKYVGIKILVFFVALLIYEPIANMTGGTIGYRTMGMKIRCSNDINKKIRFSQALMRSAMTLAFGWISFLTISTDPQRRAMHDKASGTVVINAKHQ
jgi:uncharacterized RDD family membrane protein YckC